MRIRELMTPLAETISPGALAEQAWRRLKNGRFHHLVVTERGRVVGVLSDQDLREVGASGRQRMTVEDLMTGKVVTANPTMPLEKAALLLKGRSIGCLPVVDKKELVGILTTTDLLQWIHSHGERPATGRAPKATRRTARWPRSTSQSRH
ncbi:MAG: CBS domain-containing protein [Deltaproteobacteria bacterium]|nr:CBS domain-containing protein [Deltaproteobacteria bacterium]